MFANDILKDNIKIAKKEINLILPLPLYILSIILLFLLLIYNFIMILLINIDNNFYKFIPGSTILYKKDSELIKSWINANKVTNKVVEFKRIFKASIDGEISELFYMRCSNKGASLVVAELEGGCVFGGYTSIGWDWNLLGYQKDEEAFLFNLNYQQKYNVIHPEEAIFNSPLKGPTFGYPDLEIGDLCLTRKTAFVVPGVKFSSPVNYTLSCGRSDFFKLVDYEVFSVIFNK